MAGEKDKKKPNVKAYTANPPRSTPAAPGGNNRVRIPPAAPASRRIEIAPPMPDNPSIYLTGRYQSVDSQMRYTLGINQAGKHLQGWLALSKSPITGERGIRFQENLANGNQFDLTLNSSPTVYSAAPGQAAGTLKQEGGLLVYVTPTGAIIRFKKLSDATTLSERLLAAIPEQGIRSFFEDTHHYPLHGDDVAQVVQAKFLVRLGGCIQRWSVGPSGADVGAKHSRSMLGRAVDDCIREHFAQCFELRQLNQAGRYAQLFYSLWCLKINRKRTPRMLRNQESTTPN